MKTDEVEFASDEDLANELIKRFEAKGCACVVLYEQKSRDGSGDFLIKEYRAGSSAALGLAENFAFTFKMKHYDQNYCKSN